MPELTADARKQLLINQFLAGLPASLSHQLRAGGNTADLDELVQHAKILMVVDNGERQTAAQVAALQVAKKSDRNLPQCYY